MRRSRPAPSLFALVAGAFALAGASACGGGSGALECTGDERVVETIFNGTLQPSFLPITPEQTLAIGELPACSGTLIAPTWVLTANHCGLTADAQFCIGADPANPNFCVNARRVVDHPDAPGVDLTLVELERDIRETAPVIPIAVMTDLMDDSYIGQIAEASGYGLTETGAAGTRFFVAERIIGITDYVTVDGEGVHGVCFGDSGGPTMVLAPDGSIRVAGALSFGDDSCLDVDNFTRVDLHLAWIESFTGPTVVEQPGCGGIDAVGRCVGGRALFCAGGDELRSDACPADQVCGWDDAAAGFRCISGPDPCQGFDTFGACVDGVANWCENGAVLRRDCVACGEQCGPVGGVGVYCLPDPCDGLDFTGRCNGDVAEWCEGGQFMDRDCGALGQTCGFIDDEIGFYCQE